MPSNYLHFVAVTSLYVLKHSRTGLRTIDNQSYNRYTGKMSTCVKHMFQTTHVEHMFKMCETCDDKHMFDMHIFYMFNICLIHM